MSYFSALQEFAFKARAILPVMTDASISRDKKRETLCMLVDDLSEDTFKRGFTASRLMTIINMKKDVCNEYEDTEAQVSGILSWLPRMKLHHKRLEKEVKQYRKKYGLKM